MGMGVYTCETNVYKFTISIKPMGFRGPRGLHKGLQDRLDVYKAGKTGGFCTFRHLHPGK